MDIWGVHHTENRVGTSAVGLIMFIEEHLVCTGQCQTMRSEESLTGKEQIIQSCGIRWPNR